MHCEWISVLFLQVFVHLFLCLSTIILFNAGFSSFTAHLQFSSAHCYSLLLTALLSLRLALLWCSFPLYLVVHTLSSFPLQCTAAFDDLPFILVMFCTYSSSINFLQFKFNLVTIHHFIFLLL